MTQDKQHHGGIGTEIGRSRRDSETTRDADLSRVLCQQGKSGRDSKVAPSLERRQQFRRVPPMSHPGKALSRCWAFCAWSILWAEAFLIGLFRNAPSSCHILHTPRPPSDCNCPCYARGEVLQIPRLIICAISLANIITNYIFFRFIGKGQKRL